MRQYVPEQDAVLRRTGENLSGENLSAAVARLQHDEPAKLTALTDIVKNLPEQGIRTIEFGEVMLDLGEISDSEPTTVSAATEPLSWPNSES